MTERAPKSIGDMIVLLRNCDQQADVFYDFPPYQFPTEISSYRGYYNMPALGHAGADGHSDSSVNMRGRKDEAPKVSALIAELEKAISGKVYEGWKGGDYTYSDEDFLWVSNPGTVSECAIVGVLDKGYRVILRTAHLDW